MPMSVWLVAALWGLVFVGSFDLLAKQFPVPRTTAFENHNRQRIERFAQLGAEKPNKKRIVILGNSMTKYATNIDETTMTFDAIDNFVVIRVVNNWANFSDFAPLTKELLALRPDLILMQADLLGRKRVLQRMSHNACLQSYLGWKMAGRGDWNPLKIDQIELQTDQVDFDDQSDSRFKRREKSVTEWQTIDLKSSNATLARTFVEEALSRNVPVAMLIPPVTERANALQQQSIDVLTPTLTELEQAGAVILNYPGGTLTDDHFSDFVHMNELGRAHYMPWLLSQLREMLK